MFYLDSQRTTTRRDSSLIISRRTSNFDEDVLSTCHSTARMPPGSTQASESASSLALKPLKPKSTVRKEIIALLFDSMLHHIIVSWESLVPPKAGESGERSVSKSELNFKNRKKTPSALSKSSRRSKVSRIEVDDNSSNRQTWVSFSDERAAISFRNGNLYEGSISMRCMHGLGRFQWANGTIYMGEFKDNVVSGKGRIEWKDDTWYEGDFVGAMRHGTGLFVDSRKQRSFAGGWHCGTKHGAGIMTYSRHNADYYEGAWAYNVRQGFGTRIYCQHSVYEGEWVNNIREGEGLMIWPNHDIYKGFWRNGVMTDYGVYMWGIFYNNTMSPQELVSYKGQWEKGERHGNGVLLTGFGLGSSYTGEFKNNKKHGSGMLVSNTGLLLKHKNLFIDDNLGSLRDSNLRAEMYEHHRVPKVEEPFQFDISDVSIGLYYHIEQALKNIDREQEERQMIITDYCYNNHLYNQLTQRTDKTEEPFDLGGFIEFEQRSLRKALQCYETQLRNIYYQYAVICNSEDIVFKPVLIRLYLWQLYYDCKLHDKGLTFVEIDTMFYENPDWLCKSAHDPFEKIYYWQFLHCMISLSRVLYAQRTLPKVKPETILASAFRKFMDTDVLPLVGERLGKLTNVYSSFIPLHGIYAVYRSIGEPHTARDFIRAVRYSPLQQELQPPPQHPVLEDHMLPLGQNAYVYGGDMSFLSDANQDYEGKPHDLKLFVLGNLSTKNITKILGTVLPKIYKQDFLVDLNVPFTFFEFFEAFVICVEESIKLNDEEAAWRHKFAEEEEINPI